MVQWHRIVLEADLRARKSFEVVIGQRIIALLVDGDSISAIDAVCAHQGGPIAKGQVADGCVTCPWHGWRYDLSDGKNVVTGKKMLETYSVRVIDVWVEIAIEN
jgi:nitrite reductase (NADH) small subunit